MPLPAKTTFLYLLEEAVDDLLFGFLLGQAEGHELNELFACDLADRGFVDEACIDAGSGQLGAGKHDGFIHDDGVALGMARAGAVAVEAADEILLGSILGNGTGHDVCRRAVAVEIDGKIGIEPLL